MNNVLIDKIKGSKEYSAILRFLEEERKTKLIYPETDRLLYALENMKSDLKVVIIGQDPYHNPNQANGLAFSVSRECKKLPPSLRNIYKELKDDLADVLIPEHGDLSYWSEQGVLLLNSTLSVEKNKPNSHSKIGWCDITDDIVSYLNDNYTDLVFILWGKYAQDKGASIDTEKHYVIKSAHPSPFSAHRGFFGSKPFSKANQYLQDHNKEVVDWSIK